MIRSIAFLKVGNMSKSEATPKSGKILFSYQELKWSLHSKLYFKTNLKALMVVCTEWWTYIHICKSYDFFYSCVNESRWQEAFRGILYLTIAIVLNCHSSWSVSRRRQQASQVGDHRFVGSPLPVMDHQHTRVTRKQTALQHSLAEKRYIYL